MNDHVWKKSVSVAISSALHKFQFEKKLMVNLSVVAMSLFENVFVDF